jgi:hypothetical protein
LKAGERSDARRKDGLRTRTAGSLLVFEKHQQLLHRHAPSFIRAVLDRFRQRTLTADPATDPPGISPPPQAKGKVEREPPFWPGRWPPDFASEKIAETEVAHPPIDALRAHHNAQEGQRELGQTPQRAGEQAWKEKRSALRPPPRRPWWIYVGSGRTPLNLGPAGRVPIGTPRLRRERPPGSRGVLLPPTRTATTPCGPPRPIPNKNPCSASPIAPNEHSRFANYKKFLF